jgi:fatty acid desaturase
VTPRRAKTPGTSRSSNGSMERPDRRGGRSLLLYLAAGPWTWIAGVLALGYQIALEAQLNHSIMHGADLGLPGAGRFTPDRYETLAIPFQSKTWRDAHRIHHGHPSLLGDDPDTVHPLFRAYSADRERRFR